MASSDGNSLPAFFDALGLTIDRMDAERVLVQMTVPAAFYTDYGAIHGGALSAAMDTVGGMVVATHVDSGWRIATHSLNLNYTSFVRERECTISGHLLALAKTTATVEIEARRTDDSLAVKALGVYGIFQPRREGTNE